MTGEPKTRTQCPKGHDLTQPGAVIVSGHHKGACWACRRQGKDRWVNRKRERLIGAGLTRRGGDRIQDQAIEHRANLIERVSTLDFSGYRPQDFYLPVPARVLVADPPWPVPALHIRSSKDYGAPPPPPFPSMSAKQILDFPLPPLLDEAVLFLWRLSSFQELAIETCKAWGFRPFGEMVWVKKTAKGNPWFGMGTVVRGSHESVLIGIKNRSGHFKDLKPMKAVRSCFEAKWQAHSTKPEELQDMIEEMWPEGPWVETFARRKKPGWLCYGVEIDGNGEE